MDVFNFKGHRLEYKRSHRALREYERMTGKAADEIKSYTEVTDLMYCIVKIEARRAGIEFGLTVDEFMEHLDTHPEDGFEEGIKKKEKAPAAADEQKKSD